MHSIHIAARRVLMQDSLYGCCRHDGNRWLSILSVLATALLLKESDGDGSNAHAWAENLMKAIATIKKLLQQLQSWRSGKRTARSATSAKGKTEADSNETANLCQLAHAALSAISSLRKTVQANALQAPYSGCKAGKIHIHMHSERFHFACMLWYCTGH